MKCLGDLDGNGQRAIDRDGTLLEPIGKRLAFDQFHDEEDRAVLFADVVQRADVRMAEPGDGACFTGEPFFSFRDRCPPTH
jgi:hypothetical protein